MAISLPMRTVSSCIELLSKASSSQLLAFCSVNSASRNCILLWFVESAASSVMLELAPPLADVEADAVSDFAVKTFIGATVCTTTCFKAHGSSAAASST